MLPSGNKICNLNPADLRVGRGSFYAAVRRRGGFVFRSFVMLLLASFGVMGTPGASVGESVAASADILADADIGNARDSTSAFIERLAQRDEIVTDAEYEKLIHLCREAAALADPFAPENRGGKLHLRLNEVELFTFWAIDGYLGDLVKLQTAEGLLLGCEHDMKQWGVWERAPVLTGRVLCIRASILMLKAYRMSQLPEKFEELLPLLERARDLFRVVDPKNEIKALHTLGRVLVDLAFMEETSDERYEELMARAVGIFREALALSDRHARFMRTTLTIQLGNTLNNMNDVEEALAVLRGVLPEVDIREEPNRSLALRLDIAQVLVARYLETGDASDLKAAEQAVDEALKIDDMLTASQVVPHVRFNLAMTLFMMAEEKRDPLRNGQAIREIEKTLQVWTFESFTDLHLLALDRLSRFLDLQDSLTQDVRCIDRAIGLLKPVVDIIEEDEKYLADHGILLGNLYERLSELYFKRALYETGYAQRDAYNLSRDAEKRAEALRKEVR